MHKELRFLQQEASLYISFHLKQKYMYTIEPYVYMYTWSCFELWMWNKKAVLPKPWIKQTYICIYIYTSFALIKKISHLHSKRQNIHFLKHTWLWQRIFGNSSSALHHIPGCKRESPRKDFLNGLFVSQTTIAAKTAGKNGWVSACNLKAD